MPLQLNIIYLILPSLFGIAILSFVALYFEAKRLSFIVTSLFSFLIFASSIYAAHLGTDAMYLGAIHIYPFSMFLTAIISIGVLLVGMSAYDYSKDYCAFAAMLSLSLIAGFIVATSSTLLSILLGLELMAILASMLILLEGRHRIEAAVKLFIMGSLFAALFTFGAAILLQFNNGISLNGPIAGTGYALILAMLLIISSLGFETAIFPFNLWIPDVYAGSPGFITAMLAGINKKVAFVALILVLFVSFGAMAKTYSPIIEALAIFTMFYGNLLALSQKNVKRMLAYSSISQAGYILIGIAAANVSGISAAIFYIFAHSFMIIGAFVVIMVLESKNIQQVDEYTGLLQRSGILGISLSIFMLSMAGIPPLIGFFGKFLLFYSAVNSKLLFLAIVGVVNSFISIYYYGRVINSIFTQRKQRHIHVGITALIAIIVPLIIVVAFGLFPQPIINLASIAAKSVI